MRRLILAALLVSQAAHAARGITGTDKLAGPTTALPLTGSVSVREYHTWAQNDGSYHILFETENGTDNFFTLLKTAANRIQATWSIAAGASRTSLAENANYTLPANQWNVITVTWTVTVNTFPTIYINGTLVNTVEDNPGGGGVVGSISTSPNPWNTGNRGTGGFPWVGKVADIGVWSVVLSGSDITALSGCAVHPSTVPTGLVNEWDLAGSSLTAQAGGVNLTATGTTTESDQTCSSFTISPTSILPSTGSITLSLTGTGTAWDSTTRFTLSGAPATGTTCATGCSNSPTVTNSTHVAVVISTGATTGTLTLTESVTGTAVATVSVAAAGAAPAVHRTVIM